MEKNRILDRPIEDPDRDLLGMKPYAEKLAELLRDVTPPFTVAIHGEWGEGKTSFVKLLRHYLEAQATGAGKVKPKFIELSAWQYNTSDELWRALIITIAKALRPEDSAPPDSPLTTVAEAVLPAQAPPSANDQTSTAIPAEFCGNTWFLESIG